MRRCQKGGCADAFVYGWDGKSYDGRNNVLSSCKDLIRFVTVPSVYLQNLIDTF